MPYIKEQLDGVRGHLVNFPLNFLKNGSSLSPLCRSTLLMLSRHRGSSGSWYVGQSGYDGIVYLILVLLSPLLDVAVNITQSVPFARCSASVPDSRITPTIYFRLKSARIDF